MNTLLVNGTVFVSPNGTATDADALEAYRALDPTAIPVFTREMAEQGHGNIHCVTMNYPPGSFISNLKLP
jgi:agmatine/peptidylarginine deiminase